MWLAAQIPIIIVIAAAAFVSGCTQKRQLGNVLRYALREKFKSMDPAHGSEHFSNIEIRRAYEGLLQYHYLLRPYVVEPLLAEAMPTVSKDGLTYTFKIRQGVMFHDDPAFGKSGKGREVNADDFVYSFKRLADPREASDGWWIFDGKIVGLNEWAEAAKKSGRADFDAPVEGLKALDRYTLQIKLKKPSPVFLHILTMPYTNVVAREVVEHYGKEFIMHPVGTGPFRLESMAQNQVVWVRNPTYHPAAYPKEGEPGDNEAGRLADAGKQLPFVDKIIDDVIIDDQPAWLNFMQGNHDYLPKISKDNSADVLGSDHKPRREILDKGIEVLVQPGIWFNYVAFNMEDPVVGGEKNKFLRKAMSLAFDEGPAIEKFYLGMATKAESLIPPGVAGYDPKYKNPAREYNLVKAREILAKAGHPNGEGIPEIVYATKGDMTFRQVGEYFQRQMAQLGIKIRIEQMSWPELIKRIRTKQLQTFAVSWVYDYPDAENGWQLLYSKNESPGANEANYKNPKFDVLYERIANMRDGPERFAVFKKMREFLSDDVPWIFTVHQMETRMAHPWLKNLKIHAFDHCVEKYLRIDTAERLKALQR